MGINGGKGRKLYIDGTPEFFVNGKRIPGAKPYTLFKRYIDTALNIPN